MIYDHPYTWNKKNALDHLDTNTNSTYCWWKKSGVHQLRLVVYPIIFRFLNLPGGAIFPNRPWDQLDMWHCPGSLYQLKPQVGKDFIYNWHSTHDVPSSASWPKFNKPDKANLWGTILAKIQAGFHVFGKLHLVSSLSNHGFFHWFHKVHPQNLGGESHDRSMGTGMLTY